MQTYTLPVDPGALNYRVIPPIYRGDGVALEVAVHDRGGDPVSDLTFYDVLVILSSTPAGHPSNAPNIADKHLVLDEASVVAPGRVRFEFFDDELAPLIDGRSYYLNAWSRREGDAPVPQGTAILTIYQSLSLDNQPAILPALGAGEEFLAFEDGAFVAFSDGALMTQMEPV